ncbi:MAG: TIGR01212 family radical SAM protein [Bacteroides sp.]|nr:TIGR01212 family radical SAM protein [Bacteroides sp.]MCM1414004.1 TIGR01212 family radical SAM protein [Bacteroides sp.]MCM1472301.1 TIGR01212 family radical SAM protein [Bacteroides sp.]
MIRSFAHFIADYLPGKIQKLTINAGYLCPNRDGSKGTGGCIYCNNASFSPAYTLQAESIDQQIAQGKQFFARKYPNMRYIAYFQGYTSTNAPVDRLIDLYRHTLSIDGIEGIIIGTRPDCMPQRLLDELAELRKTHFVMMEYGAETSHDRTLALINRCHTWAETVDAVNRTAAASIPVGLHLIFGLPGESKADILATIDRINSLPINTLKCHQLQVIRNTALAAGIELGKYAVESFTPENYADLCLEVLDRLRDDITVERFVSQAPSDLLISPRWGLKNYQFVDLLNRRSKQLHCRHTTSGK